MSRIRVARSARRAESLLLEDLETHLQACSREPRLLALPIRVVVPSRVLRRHLSARIVEDRGHAAAGVVVQSVHQLALDVLDRAGVPARAGSALREILARRHARHASGLSAVLAEMVDGFGSILGSVDDLLQAGFEPALEEALLERLGDLGAADSPRLRRTSELLRVAARVCEDMERLGLESQTDAMRRASAIVLANPEALHARAVFVHGFADATGVTIDFLQSLMHHAGAHLYLERPADPADPERSDPGASFGDSLAERLGADERDPEAPGDRPRLELFSAAGTHLEAREIAHRTRALIEKGIEPERIAIVARELERYALPLRIQLERLGIPYSGHGALGPPGAAARRLHRLVELLRGAGEIPTAHWLDLNSHVGLVGDVRLALLAMGAARLRDVAALDLEAILGDQDSYALPIRRGLGGIEGDDADEAQPVARRRRVDASRLYAACATARALIQRMEAWPRLAPIVEHRRQLRELIDQGLAWPADGEERNCLLPFGEELPQEFEVESEEWIQLLAGFTRDALTQSLGGNGGGVCVLSVMESRAHSFDALFVAGLNRGVFPRPIREDPLLPDDIRGALRSLLPDLGAKAAGYDEERYLFAQLLGAAPIVCMSWLESDDDGKAMTPSSLVQRLRWARPDCTIEAAEDPLAPGDRNPSAGPLTAFEWSQRAALSHGAPALEQFLPLALGQQNEETHRIARARRLVLEEFERPARAGVQMGPYFGFVGAPRHASDPRRRDLFVSALEGMARCPWQSFLRRILRLEVTPDPLAALPSIEPILVGNVVHGCLERIVREGASTLSEDLPEALQCQGVQLPWPEKERVELILQGEATRVVRDAGIGLPGLARAVAAHARPYLARAHTLLWSNGDPHVLGTELEGSAIVVDAGDARRRIRFKADLVEGDEHHVRLTDFKTGGPLSMAKKDDTRRNHFLKAVRAGTRLQAPLYLLAAEQAQGDMDGPLRGGAGQLLFLRPDLDDVSSRDQVATGDGDFVEALRIAARTLLLALDTGSFFPRLLEPGGATEPRACSNCEVAEACLRGDTSAGRRLFAWLEDQQMRTKAGERPALIEAMVDVWNLPGGGT